MTALHGCSLIKVFFLPRIDSPAQTLHRSFHIIQTLPHQINVHTSAPQKVPTFIAFVQTTRRLVQNIVTMCSISARAAHSAVSAMATALPGSNAKCPTPPPLGENGKSTEQMLRCHFCPSAAACDGPACSQWVSLRL